MTRVLPVDALLVEYVARNMRADDWREISLLAKGDVVEECVTGACISDIAAVIAKDVPIAVMGAHRLYAGVWTAWMFATDRWPEVALTATKHALRVMKPRIIESGAHRMEARSIADHHQAHAWLSALGAIIESEMPGCGLGGEPYLMFAWRKADHV